MEENGIHLFPMLWSKKKKNHNNLGKQERGFPFADCDWPLLLSITKEWAYFVRPLRQAWLFSWTSPRVCRVWQVYPDYHGDRSETLVDISIRSCRILGACCRRTLNLRTLANVGTWNFSDFCPLSAIFGSVFTLEILIQEERWIVCRLTTLRWMVWIQHCRFTTKATSTQPC